MKKIILFFKLATAFVACTKVEDQTTSVITGLKTIKVAFNTDTTHYTLFRFSDGNVIPISDSASNNWDFGLRRSTFIVNSYSGGPGNAGAIFRDGLYDTTTTAPTLGYAYDTLTSKRAIKDGSWYDYNPQTRTFFPKAGKIFFFKTADGNHYVKMIMLSAGYEPFVGNTPNIVSYIFKYTYQSNGSATF